MALLHMDGFDRYGPVNSAASSYLTQEYTTAGAGAAIVAGLSATGSAINFASSTSPITKTLTANYARLIGGFRFAHALTGGNGGIVFLDAGTAQASVTVNISTGTISVRSGTTGGTAIATSTASVTANSVHYLEFDITFSNTGAYQVWLDGVSVISGSGDTTATANNFANQFGLNGGASGASFTVDDFYLLDTSGATNNAVLLTSPRIETQFPNADVSVQFAIGASTLGVGGTTMRGASPAVAGVAASLVLRPLTAARACTLNSISLIPLFTNAAANYRVCIYADSAGNPGALLASSTTITGAVNGTTITGTLTVPPSLAAGTQYWLGVISDMASSNHASYEVNGQGKYASNTFASGPPSTAPAMTAMTFTPLVWGTVTGIGANYYEVGQNPTSGNLSYVFDATVGHEDLYQFPVLTAPSTNIYAVAVRANTAKSDAGAKTLSLRMKSGATDSAGSVASIAPGTTYTWAGSLFTTDPLTGAAWTVAGLNAATSGIRVET